MSVAHQQLPQDIWLVTVRGRLDHTLNPELEEHLTSLLTQDKYFLIVDLSGVGYINSGGLRCLVSAWRNARAQHGDVLLCGLNERLRDIFSMIGFDKVFRILEDRAEAETKLASIRAEAS